MTQMESPKRKLQKKNDYQRHKLFRKIKRRRKAQAEADQQIAEKQLRRKLKLPKFGDGKTREVYTSDIHFNNDDAAGGVDRYGNKFDYIEFPETVVTARKIPTFKDIEKQIGRKITQAEIDKVIAVDPQIPIIDDSGNVNLANLFKIQNEALSNVPGGRLARHRLENPDWHKTDWNTFLHSRDAYQRALQAGYPNEALFPTLMHDAGKLWAGDGHGPYGASIVKQMFPDATDEQIMAIYQHMDKVPESAMGKLVKGADIKEPNQYRKLGLKDDYDSFTIGDEDFKELRKQRIEKDINIKPSRRGTFTKAAKAHGMSVQGFANKVLRNPSKYSAAMRKKANFAHNASKWNK